MTQKTHCPDPEIKRKILLVEDEVIIGMTTVQSLKKYGYETVSAMSGEKAIETFRNDGLIDLVLMDIDLGKGMDGTEAAKAILAIRDVPVVFMSSHTEPDIVAKTETITSYGYIVKNMSEAVLNTSLKMAFRLYEANRTIAKSELKQKTMIKNISDVIAIISMHGIITYVSPNVEKWFGWEAEKIIGSNAWLAVHPDDLTRVRAEFEPLQSTETYSCVLAFRYKCGDGNYREIEMTATNLSSDPSIAGVLLNFHDITEHIRLEQALANRVNALTRPLDENNSIRFEDLFDPDTIQHIQDEFAEAMGVASIITRPDGSPITRASNFTKLCSDFIRQSETGRANCYRSDAIIGRNNPEGPIVQPCLSCGLWDAGASITVGDRHIANWLIGQVRDDTQTERSMRDYALSIGVDENEFSRAFNEVPLMSVEQFTRISRNLFTVANQLSRMAFQNLQQARLINDLNNAKIRQYQAEARLTDSIRELNQCQTIAHIGSWKLNIKTKEISLSDEGRLILGYPENLEPSYKDILSRLTKEDRDRAELILEQAVDTGHPYSLEVQISRQTDGKLRTLVLNAVLLRGADGLPLEILGTVQDTTERKNAEKTLWEYGELYRTILNASPDDITVTDISGRIVMVSPMALKIFRCGEDALVNHNILDFLIEEDRERARSGLALIISGNRADPAEFKAIRGDGSTFDIEVNGEYIRGPEGLPTQMVFIVRDITRRKQAEKEKIEADLLLRTLSMAIEQSPVVTMITDAKGIIEFVNPKFIELTGYEAHEVIGQTPRLLKSGTTSSDDYKVLWQTILAGNNWRGVFQNRKKSGKLYWESAAISPVKNEQGIITHFLALKEDITERFLAGEKIKELLAEKELILREVHHRIKNNMSTIYGLLSLQSGTLKDPSAIEALNEAGSRVKSMMILYTKLYQSADVNELSLPVYLDTLVDEIAANFSNRSSVKVIKDIGNFALDTKRLQPLGIIINELVTNTMKHSFNGRDGGTITVSARLEEDQVRVSIGDDGNGIPESVDFDNSTGFGLMLVGGLAKQLKGTLSIDRKTGSKITLVFPYNRGQTVTGETNND